MKIIFYIVIFFSSATIWAHDVPMAIFEMTLTENKMMIEGQFDQDDLDQVIMTTYDRPVSEYWIRTYIMDHCDWLMDQEEGELSICSVDLKNGHYTIQAEVLFADTAFLILEIKNTCLIEEIEGHSNVLYLNYADKRRGFRLDKNRLHTRIEL